MKTIYMETGSVDPTWNLAFEEYCFTHLTDYPRIMLLWQNDNAVIVGRYQNAEREVNAQVAKNLGVKVVRRSTGGGAVYHDMGNLNYSFITPAENPESIDFAESARPMVDALRSIGIPAEAKGRNDIELDGRKISGTAQSYVKGRLLHHGTLLYDSDLTVLRDVLNVDASKIASKGIASVRSRVANIKEAMGWNADMPAFWRDLLAAFPEMERRELDEAGLAEVRKLQKTKYRAWDWSYGAAPAYGYVNAKRFPGGKIEVCLNVERGLISGCKISGDFLALTDISALENALVGVKREPQSVREVLAGFPPALYLGGITPDELIECMFEL